MNLLIQRTGTELDIDAVFADLARQKVGAALVISDPFFTMQRDQIAALAVRHAIPAVFELREFAAAGGLISYGPNLANGYHRAGVYAGKISQGRQTSRFAGRTADHI